MKLPWVLAADADAEDDAAVRGAVKVGDLLATSAGGWSGRTRTDVSNLTCSVSAASLASPIIASGLGLRDAQSSPIHSESIGMAASARTWSPSPTAKIPMPTSRRVVVTGGYRDRIETPAVPGAP